MAAPSDIQSDEGWLCQAVVMDPFNREVVGWSLKPKMTVDIVIEAPSMAFFRKKPPPGSMHHCDRKSPSANGADQARPEEYGTICAMRRAGTAGTTRQRSVSATVCQKSGGMAPAMARGLGAEADVLDFIEPFYHR